MNEAEILNNWTIHNRIIDTYITTRKDLVKNMLSKLEDTYVLAPASGKTWHYNAFPGGYVEHVNRVVQYSLKQSELFKEMGGTIDYSVEELVFSALFYGLGRLGNGLKNNYLPQTDKWRKDKLQEEYSINPELDFMLFPDRSLFLLQGFGIKLTQKEYIAIKTHEGMNEINNKPYLENYSEHSKLKSNLSYILHTAELLATKVAHDKWQKTTAPKQKVSNDLLNKI